MKYYTYKYPNGDSEFYRVIDGIESKMSVRTGRIECVGISNNGPPITWLEKNAEVIDGPEFETEYQRVLSRVIMTAQGR